jgi:hypothetical protein
MKKSKLITLAVSFLLTIGMIGAGFAAWVISAPTQETVEGTVTVDTVVDKRIQLSDPVTTLAGVTFGAPTTSSTGWLTHEGTVKQDLVSEFSFNITNQKALFEAGVEQITLTFALNTENLTSYVTSNYITLPATANVKVGTAEATDATSVTIDITDSADPISVTVKYTFGWGNAFGGNNTNPYTFFAGKEPNDPSNYTDPETEKTLGWADFALKALNEIAAMNAKKFGVTVTASVVEPTPGV